MRESGTTRQERKHAYLNEDQIVQNKMGAQVASISLQMSRAGVGRGGAGGVIQTASGPLAGSKLICERQGRLRSPACGSAAASGCALLCTDGRARGTAVGLGST